MFRTRSAVVLATILVTVSALGRDTRKELVVDLAFVPQEGVQVTSPDLLPAVLERSVALRIEDGRGGTDVLTIGQGTNDDDLTFPIRAASDIVPWLEQTLNSVATGWGLKMAGEAERRLTLRIARFNVDESNKAVGSMYAAEVKLTYTLDDARGRRLMEGAASGSAHRYGRARSAANCSEVLSDASKEAFANVLSEPRLQQAWSSGTPAKGATGASESAEERLRKLDELLKKKLISKEEYDRKRAEILKEL